MEIGIKKITSFENKSLLSVINSETCTLVSVVDAPFFWQYCNTQLWCHYTLSYRSIATYRLKLLSMCVSRLGCDVRAKAGCGVC